MSEKRRDHKGRNLHTGEFQLKDGSYVYRYTDIMGKRQQLRSWRLNNADITPQGKKDMQPLRDQERYVMVQIGKGICSNGITVCELVDRYIQTRVGVRASTRTGYKTVKRLLEKEEFGARPIDKVKYSDAKLFLIKLQSNGRSYSSVHSIRGVLRPAFQMALEDQMIPFNPFDFELAKILINDSVQRQALTKTEEEKFLNFIMDDEYYNRYYEGIYILFKTGLRISEFCGLTKSDIDLKNKTIRIDHQLQRTNEGEYIIAVPKTNAGIRTLPIDDNVCDCFRKILQKRATPKVEPMIDGKTGFLFLDKNGMPTVAMHWEKYFQHIREKYNKIYRVQLPMITPHVCRHTYCTNMAKRGISAKTLQYLMGHSDISVTMNVYTHLGLQDAQEELARLDSQKELESKRYRKNASNF